MATLLQLVNEVLRRTGQTEVTTLTGAQAPVIQTVDFLNETYFEMFHLLKLNRLQRQATLSTSNGVQSYTLASDANINTLLPDSVIETGSGLHLREVDYTYPLEHGLSLTGRPEVFYRQGNSLYLYPIPNGVYTLQYQYLLKPAQLSGDSTTTQLPVEWEKTLIRGTQARLEAFLGEDGFSASYSLYQQGLLQLKAQAPLKPTQRMRGAFRGAGQ